MSPPVRITDVRYTPAGARDRQRGLLGYLAFQLGPLAIDGVTVRRTAAGALMLSYPERTDSHGLRHPLVRPVNRQSRTAIESAVWQALSFDEGGAS